MKAIKIITHPFTVIISFLTIMISGQHIGGFYFLYLLLGMPHAAIHSLLSIGGIMLLLISYNKFKRQKIYFMENVLNLVGLLMLLFSLFLFFYNDSENYNVGTFFQLIPQITLIVFSVIALFFLVNNLSLKSKSTKVGTIR